MTILTRDPATNNFVSSADPASGRTMASLTSDGRATSADPYTIFNQNLASILTQIQNSQTAGAAKLGGAKDYLTSESVSPNGPTAFNPKVFSGSQVAGQEGLESSFNPAITSVNTQLENATRATEGLKGDISALGTIFQPREVGAGSSLVTPGGTTVKQGHNYQPQYNINTNKQDGWDSVTGTWASDDAAGTGTSQNQNTTEHSGNPIIAGVDFSGKSVGMKPYATDPEYYNAIGGLYETVSSLGVANHPETLQQYIVNNAKASPVTGQMILNAASTYKIDPALLTAVMLHESDFGTAGAAVKTMNPGNVGNTGTSTQTFSSWQQGVNAVAKNLASRSGGSTTPSSQNGAVDINTDAKGLIDGTIAPSQLKARYAGLGTSGGIDLGTIMYNKAIQAAKALSPAFDESKAELAYHGKTVSTENMNSGNPVTSIFSNLKNSLTTPAGNTGTNSIYDFLNPEKNQSGLSPTSQSILLKYGIQ